MILPGHYSKGSTDGSGLWMASAFQILTYRLQLPQQPTLVSLSLCLLWGPSVRWVQCSDKRPLAVHSLVPKTVKTHNSSGM